jgi:hypothetical protein
MKKIFATKGGVGLVDLGLVVRGANNTRSEEPVKG